MVTVDDWLYTVDRLHRYRNVWIHKRHNNVCSCKRFHIYDLPRGGYHDDVLFPSRFVELRDVLVRVFLVQRIAVRHRTNYDKLFVYNEKMMNFLSICVSWFKVVNALQVYSKVCLYLGKTACSKSIVS